MGCLRCCVRTSESVLDNANPEKVSVVRINALVLVDILAGYAMWVMMTYLTDVWKLSFTHAAGILNIWGGIAKLLPIGFAFLVDAFVGNYWMLLLSTAAYTVGFGFLSMSTPPVLSNSIGTCSEYRPECIGHTQEALFYTALALIAVGISGHMVSLESFSGEQQVPTKGNTNKVFGPSSWQIAGLIAIYISAVGGGLALPYIKPWQLRFGIPAMCSLVATLLFLSGSCTRSYRRDNRQEWSPLTNVFRKLKNVPTWMTFIVWGVVTSVGNTYFVEQANHMDRKLGRIKVPLPIFLMFQTIAKELFKAFKCFGKYGSAVAMIFSALSCIAAAIVETKRLGVVRSHGLVDKPDDRIPMSIFCLLPQFLLLGALDAMSENSFDCFFPNQDSSQDSSQDSTADSPPKTKYPPLFRQGVNGLGTMVSVLSVYIADKVSEKGGKPSWFQETINKSHLDNYFWTLAALSAINFGFCILVAFCWFDAEQKAPGCVEGHEGIAIGSLKQARPPKSV